MKERSDKMYRIIRNPAAHNLSKELIQEAQTILKELGVKDLSRVKRFVEGTPTSDEEISKEKFFKALGHRTTEEEYRANSKAMEEARKYDGTNW